MFWNLFQPIQQLHFKTKSAYFRSSRIMSPYTYKIPSSNLMVFSQNERFWIVVFKHPISIIIFRNYLLLLLFVINGRDFSKWRSILFTETDYFGIKLKERLLVPYQLKSKILNISQCPLIRYDTFGMTLMKLPQLPELKLEKVI